MLDVTPFKPSYRLYNKTTRSFTGEVFDCPLEALGAIREKVTRVQYDQPWYSQTLRLEADFTYKVCVARSFTVDEGKFYGASNWYRMPRSIYITKSVPAAEYCIRDSFGSVITEADLNAVRRELRNRYFNHRYSDWEARRENTGKRLTRTKGSGAKIKAVCEQVRSTWGSGEYTNRVRGYYRSFRTANELRQNEAHTNEYGRDIVRPRRGARHLPRYWDDKSVAISRAEGSWKHHSKRRKQWVPK